MYARQLLLPVLYIGLAIYAIVMGIIIWIAVEVSSWWLLLGLLPTFFAVVGGLLWLIIWTLAGRIGPQLSPRQKKATKKVVNDVGKVAEQLGIGRIVLMYRIIKDVASKRKSSQTFIGELAETPGKLHQDFDDLRRLF